MAMPNSSQQSDKIFIRDLTLNMFLGIYDHEKHNTQRVIFNIELNVESNFGKDLKSIDDVVSYEHISNEVKRISQAKNYELAEELAEEIASLCLMDQHVICAHITIEKPDIIENAKSVGVSIIRMRA